MCLHSFPVLFSSHPLCTVPVRENLLQISAHHHFTDMIITYGDNIRLTHTSTCSMYHIHCFTINACTWAQLYLGTLFQHKQKISYKTSYTGHWFQSKFQCWCCCSICFSKLHKCLGFHLVVKHSPLNVFLCFIPSLCHFQSGWWLNVCLFSYFSLILFLALSFSVSIPFPTIFFFKPMLNQMCSSASFYCSCPYWISSLLSCLYIYQSQSWHAAIFLQRLQCSSLNTECTTQNWFYIIFIYFLLLHPLPLFKPVKALE